MFSRYCLHRRLSSAAPTLVDHTWKSFTQDRSHSYNRGGTPSPSTWSPMFNELL